MSLKLLRIATRKSPLAIWQAEFVRAHLVELYPDMEVQLLPVKTEGDRILDKPLATVGGKGLFLKELEQQLLDNVADIAVHSMKDVTVEMPPGMSLPVILKRGDPRDALVSNDYSNLNQLPAGAIIGTSSLRRQSQLSARRPDLVIRSLRGNVGTRLDKLDKGEYDGIILAASGLTRLKLESRIKQYIDPDIILPAIGQGAIGIETRADDHAVIQALLPLNDRITSNRLQAERSFSRRLFGGCQLPIAAYAEIKSGMLFLAGLVASIDGQSVIADRISGSIEDADSIGIQLAEKLLERGADKILEEVLHDN